MFNFVIYARVEGVIGVRAADDADGPLVWQRLRGRSVTVQRRLSHLPKQ